MEQTREEDVRKFANLTWNLSRIFNLHYDKATRSEYRTGSDFLIEF